VQIDALKRRVAQLNVIAGGFPGGNGADPTAQVILTAVNGTLTTWMRSDAAPPLSQAIAPTMTGTWNFTPSANVCPITINGTNLTSAHMEVWNPDSGYDTIVNRSGDVWIGDEAGTAMLSIRARSATISDFGPLFWYKAEDYPGGTRPQTWTDSSGNGYDMVSHNWNSLEGEDNAGRTDGPRKNSVGALTTTPPDPVAGSALTPTNLPSVDSNWYFNYPTPGNERENYFQLSSGDFPDFGSAHGGFTLFYIIHDYGGTNVGSHSFPVIGSSTVANDSIWAGDDGTTPNKNAKPFTIEGASGKDFCTALSIAEGLTEVWGVRIAATSGALRATYNGTLQTSASHTRTNSFTTVNRLLSGANHGGAKGNSLVEVIGFAYEMSDADMTIINDLLLAEVAGTAVGSTQDLTHWKDSAGTLDSFVDASINWGIGLAAASAAAKVHIRRATAPQLRIDRDASDYVTISVAATGDVTFDAFGASPSFTFADPVNFGSTVSFQSATFGVPVSVDLAANSAGVATTISRSDHKHDLDESIAPVWTGIHRHSNYVEYDEMAAPGTPAANRVRLYAKDDTGVSSLFFKKDDGTEINLGAGSGDITTDPAWTALGDLIVGTGVSTASILPVGADTFVLSADSGEATGLKWVALAGGGDALVANPLSQFAATTSAQLAGVITDETGFGGTGVLVFNNNPTLVSLSLPTTTSATTGIIFKNSIRWAHDFTNAAKTAGQAQNIFIGDNAGNFTIAGTGLQGVGNVGIGDSALIALTTGSQNFAFGWDALTALTSGRYNVALGVGAGQSLTTTDSSVFIGAAAGANATGSRVVAIGDSAGGNHGAGDDSIFIGQGADSSVGTEANAIAIGAGTIVDADNKTVIGNLNTTLTEVRGNFNIRDQVSGDIATINVELGGSQTLYVPQNTGYIWVDNSVTLLSNQDPLLDWNPVTAGGGGIRLWAGGASAANAVVAVNTSGLVGISATGAVGSRILISGGGGSPDVEIGGSGFLKATRFNKVTITEPASQATLTIADNKTLTVNDNATLQGAGTYYPIAIDAIWAAKGDLLGGIANDAAAILPVGANTFVLTADSAEATGMKWAAAAGGSGLTLPQVMATGVFGGPF